MHMKNEPRRVTRGWFLAVTLLTLLLTVPGVKTILENMQMTGGSLLQANALADVAATALSVLLCLGMLLAIALPGRHIGYRMAALVLRLYNVFWLALLGMLGLAFVALMVVACLQIISVPMALGALAAALAAAAAMTLTALYVHHLAECLKELSISAQAGAWQTPTGHKCPLMGMSWGMLALGALLLVGTLLCAAGATHEGIVALFDGAVEAIHTMAPTASRTLVRTLGERLRPMLDVPTSAVVVCLLECLRYAAIAAAYRQYMRMNAAFKAA